MTDQDIVNFIVHRAEVNGLPQKLHSPELVLVKCGGITAVVALQYEGHNEPFMLRFTNGTQRGLFKLKYNQEDLKKFTTSMPSCMKYDVETLPSWFKHFVSYAVIDALKTKGMGFDAFAISRLGDIELIRPEETYEEAAIETDLLALGIPDELTSF